MNPQGGPAGQDTANNQNDWNKSKKVTLKDIFGANEHERRGRKKMVAESVVLDFSQALDESEVQSVLDDHLRRGNLLSIEIIGFTSQFNAEPHARLSGEAIMKHIKCETFVSVEKENPKEDERCSICLEEYEDGEQIGKLDLCVHKFHVECIKQWVMKRNECPICRQIALTVNNVENEVGA